MWETPLETNCRPLFFILSTSTLFATTTAELPELPHLPTTSPWKNPLLFHHLNRTRVNLLSSKRPSNNSHSPSLLPNLMFLPILDLSPLLLILFQKRVNSIQVWMISLCIDGVDDSTVHSAPQPNSSSNKSLIKRHVLLILFWICRMSEHILNAIQGVHDEYVWCLRVDL